MIITVYTAIFLKNTSIYKYNSSHLCVSWSQKLPLSSFLNSPECILKVGTSLKVAAFEQFTDHGLKDEGSRNQADILRSTQIEFPSALPNTVGQTVKNIIQDYTEAPHTCNGI